MRDNFEFLDVITVLSFILQLNNNGMQSEIDKAVDDIHRHLKEQDDKINQILERQVQKDDS
jgi:hypothetical protein